MLHRIIINLFFVKYLFFMIILCFVMPLSAQSVEKSELILKWERLASRADEVLEKSQASNDTLKIILADLLKQRKEVYDTQVFSESKISKLSEELEALGLPPDRGITENTIIASRRADLKNLIEITTVPFVISSGMLKRTDFLIQEANMILRERLTQKLFSYGATPFDSGLWPTAFRDIKGFLSRMVRETMTVLNSDTQRTLFFQKIPIMTVLITVGIFLFFIHFKGVLYGTFHFVANPQSKVFVPLVEVSLNSLSYLLLFLSGFVVIQAFKFSGLFGYNGITFIDALIPVVVTLVCSRWLSQNLCHDKIRLQELGGLVVDDGRTGSKFFNWLGILFSISILINYLAEAGSWTVGTQAILHFPLLTLTSVFLFQLVGLLRQNVSPQTDDPKEQLNKIKFQLPIQLQNLLRIIIIVAPILAAAGYLYAAQKLIYPILVSLALIALSSIIFSILYSIFDAFSDPSVKVKGKLTGSRWALVPVLLVLVLGGINVPIIALIWGAQSSDIHEIWLRLNEGIPLGSARVTLPGLISLVVIFCFGFALTRLTQRVLRNSVLPKTTLDSGGRNALLSGVGYSGIILSTMIAISSTGLDLSSLAIVAGALSVGLGFGLQTIVSNFVSGVILLIERPIKEGDWIEVAGFSGTVRKISVRSTQIQTFDRGTVIVPNSELISGSVLNYTHSNSMGRVRVPVGVAYGTDPRRVETILLRIAESHPQVLKDPGPSVVFMGFGSDSIDFEIRAFMKDVGYVLAIKSEMNYEITEAFNKEGIEIPFAQRDVNIKNFESLKTVLSDEGVKKMQGKKND
ncbi:MAG: DUF3772 domain-containing protein [Rhodobacteraceae bacterium]|nr:MAG: DUF3772 domain-containing protein [Paracoccaceae bacterium]